MMEFYKTVPVAVSKMKGIDGETDAYRATTTLTTHEFWGSTEESAATKAKNFIDNEGY